MNSQWAANHRLAVVTGNVGPAELFVTPMCLKHVIMLATLVVYATLVGLTCPTAHAETIDGEWSMTGLAGGPAILAVAVAADWRAGGPILVARESDPGDLLSSFDGGTSWEALPPPPFSLSQSTNRPTFFGFAPLASNPRLVFALLARPQGWDFYWSPDAGRSWQHSVTGSSLADLTPRLTLSPDFTTDGMALIVGGDGSLYQLIANPGEVVADRVTSIEALSAPTRQIVRDAGFSPGFAHDRRIYAAVTSIDAPIGEDVGLLISADAGISWAPPAEQPTLDGSRFGFVDRFFIPPTSDSTLFALASLHGEPIAQRCIEGITMAGRVQTLFRSIDAGQSWSPVTTLGPACRHSVQMTFAPDFATSGVAHLTDLWTGESLTATTCEVHRTRDWGEQWRRRTVAAGTGGMLTAACGYPSLPDEITPPTDGGFPASALAVAISPSFDMDHTVFFAARGKLWRYAPSAQ